MLPAYNDQYELLVFLALVLVVGFGVWDARRRKNRPGAKSYAWLLAAVVLAGLAIVTWQRGEPNSVMGWLFAIAAFANLVTGIAVWLRPNRQREEQHSD
jgi:drug/metabolite transporter (DMT)-like permease